MRYIGSKTKLIDEIRTIINENIEPIENGVFCDLFAGTGVVADFFQDQYTVIANDTLYASYCVTKAKLLGRPAFGNLDCDPFEYFNNAQTDDYVQGFCYENFAPEVSGRQYFSDENAKFIDFIRDTLDVWFDMQRITLDEKEYLIGCLIESVSKVSNVAGVYSAYLHIWDPRALKRMEFIPVEAVNAPAHENIFYCEDAASLIERVAGDILYLDPPYTSTQYVSQYHVLETVARNDRPATHGVGAHRDNGRQISDWCKKGLVEYRFEQVIKKARFKYIVVSYSDAGLMSKEFIEKVLKRYAKPGTYKIKKIDFVKYKNTRAVKREEREKTKTKKHFEWMFVIEKNECAQYASPLNYIGGKYDVIDFLKAHFPEKVDTFYDLFGGGGTVALNASAKNVLYNDNNWIVGNLLEFLSGTDFIALYKQIVSNIKKYGLAKANKEAYYNLRSDYNRTKNPVLLYLLICYGFEHQIRFNGNLAFNNPCGNSGFNDEMLEKLVSFQLRTREQNLRFCRSDYKAFFDEISADDFVYCDPPYLATCGVYNDGKRGFNGWDEEQQNELLAFLDKLNEKRVKFMLSNFTEHDNDDNGALLNWAASNAYNVIFNDKITKRNRRDRRELIIVNY